MRVMFLEVLPHCGKERQAGWGKAEQEGGGCWDVVEMKVWDQTWSWGSGG